MSSTDRDCNTGSGNRLPKAAKPAATVSSSEHSIKKTMRGWMSEHPC